jgi:hypothetical protein
MSRKRIKKYNDFVNEHFGISSQPQGMNLSSGFGNSDLSQNSNTGEQPTDGDLSFDEYDRHKNNLKDQINRFVSIGKNVFNGGTMNYGYDFISEIEDLFIAKMFLNSNGLLDIYIRFTLDENIYYGKFEDWGGINKPTFKSKVLYHPTISNFKDNKIRIIGLIEETLIKWFTPQEDVCYRALKEVRVYNNLGQIFMIPEGGKIKIEDSILQDYKPIIYLNYSDTIYTFTGIEYYFFHWWFKKEEEKEFYL